MFSNVQMRLTVLYAGVALVFTIGLGAGCYALLDHYLESTTDLALQHKMAHEFIERNLPVPRQLAEAERDWTTSRTRFLPQPLPQPSNATPPQPDTNTTVASEEAFEGELAAIFVIPLDANGHVTLPPATAAFPIPPNQEAIAPAMQHGQDWRTVTAPNGTRIRLLTYPLHDGEDITVLQAGRTLSDQDLLLRRLLEGLSVLGSVSAVLIGFGGWWLAGRSLQPAYQAWSRQQTFVANASHELRTPLTLLRASADVAQRALPKDAADSRTLLNDVLHECDYMDALIQDLLLLSRLDAGGLRLAPQALPLADVFDDIQRQVGRVAVEHSIELTIHTEPVVVHADSMRLRQVLLALLDNALRYTPPDGQVRLSTEAQERQVQFCVEDTGCGIEPEHLSQLFERFYRADPAHASKTGGSGLGLAIAKALIEAQGGRIWVESTVDVGTKVFFTLPCAPALVLA